MAYYQSSNCHISKNDPFPNRQAYAKKIPPVYAPSTLTQHEARTQKKKVFLSIMTTYIVQCITTPPPRNALKMEHSTSKKFEVGI